MTKLLQDIRREPEELAASLAYSWGEGRAAMDKAAVRHIREYFPPRMKKIMKLVHDGGAWVIAHSDGAVRKVIPDLIEIGMDVLLWRCTGMDREGLKRDFGDKIVFHGAMDNQRTLPFGSVAEVQQEVLDNLNTLGEGGGWILAPFHNLQPTTPLENILAMYETGYEYGWQ
jgi:uroporphyrinogen decarboxylase